MPCEKYRLGTQSQALRDLCSDILNCVYGAAGHAAEFARVLAPTPGFREIRRRCVQAGWLSRPPPPGNLKRRRRKGKLFFVSFMTGKRHNRDVIGALLNALGILIGALFGLVVRKPAAARTQAFFKTALGAFTIVYGVRLIYENLHGGVAASFKQLLVAFLAVVLGYWLGRLGRLQKLSNTIGHHAATLLSAAQKNPPGTAGAGLVAATTLFCAAPLGLLGVVADGLQGYFYLLLLKGIMDGLAMQSFVKLFRWPVALSALPVFIFFKGLTWLVQMDVKPWLDTHNLTCYPALAAGLVTCIVPVVIFEVRRVELANYLPALVVAPLLGYWLV